MGDRNEIYLRKIAGEDIDISNMPEPSDRIEGYLKTIAENGGGSVDPEDIAEIVTDWLDDHVDPETGYVIDNTLLVEGAAADAKKVGDELTDVKSAINDIQTATANDVNKALSPKTVTNGKVTEWQYKVIGGGGGGAVDDVQINGTSIVDGDGVANIPLAGSNTYGAVKMGDDLTIVESVSGSTPSITGAANHRYICGECSTLAITTPASGIIDVVFESGSTPTVLTVTPPTGMTMKWANGFDPTALEANTVYELNIMNGVYGVVASWT